MLGSAYGLVMFQNQAIEKKLTGLKTINKWARYFYGSVTNTTKEDDYCKWLFESKVIEAIIEDGSSTTMMKTSTDILRLIFRKKCLDL